MRVDPTESKQKKVLTVRDVLEKCPEQVDLFFAATGGTGYLDITDWDLDCLLSHIRAGSLLCQMFGPLWKTELLPNLILSKDMALSKDKQSDENLNDLFRRFYSFPYPGLPLSGLELDSFDLEGLYVFSANIQHSSFNHTRLKGAVFNKVVFTKTTFHYADLSDAKFIGCSFYSDGTFSYTPPPDMFQGAIKEGSNLEDLLPKNQVAQAFRIVSRQFSSIFMAQDLWDDLVQGLVPASTIRGQSGNCIIDDHPFEPSKSGSKRKPKFSLDMVHRSKPPKRHSDSTKVKPPKKR